MNLSSEWPSIYDLLAVFICSVIAAYGFWVLAVFFLLIAEMVKK